MFPSPLKRISTAIVLTGDVLGMIPRIARGKTTIGDGSKIVGKFEKAFAQMTGSRYALAMNNGTATLHSGYVAVGVGPGSEVITPAYTWHAPSTPILQCCATPIFCDVDPYTLNADPDDIERKITERTKAISVVHVWGNPCEMDRIMDIADRHNIPVVEDCSHAHGAVYKGKAIGTWGAVGCFSLNSKKAVDGGEAGVAVTDDPRLFDNMLILGHFGRVKNGQAAETFDIGDMSLGHKYRPHQCAMHLAMASLKRLPGLNKRCAKAWGWLCDELEGVAGIRPQKLLPGAVRGGYQAFVLIYDGADLGGPSREDFVKAVRKEGAPLTADRYAKINYTYGMLHKAPLFTMLDRRSLGGACYDPTRPWEDTINTVTLPNCERLTEQLVSFPRMDGASKGYVRACGRAIKKVLAGFGVRERPPARQADRPAPKSADAVPSEVAV